VDNFGFSMKRMQDLLTMRQNIHAAVNVAKRFSKDINNADSEALAIL